jgi:hypothetical protein
MYCINCGTVKTKNQNQSESNSIIIEVIAFILIVGINYVMFEEKKRNKTLHSIIS